MLAMRLLSFAVNVFPMCAANHEDRQLGIWIS